MVTPLEEINRRHVIALEGYHSTHDGHVFQAIPIDSEISSQVADEVVINDSGPTYMVIEHGTAVHSKNRGVLLVLYPGSTIHIIDREDPDTILHQVQYLHAGYTTVTKQ